MMILQYAIPALWVPIAARYLSASPDNGGLGFSGTEIGLILGLSESAAVILSPFIIGQIADRHFPAERFMAFIMIVGGIFRIILSNQTAFGYWLILSIFTNGLYNPTMSLSTSIAFSHLPNSSQQFRPISLPCFGAARCQPQPSKKSWGQTCISAPFCPCYAIVAR